MSQVHDRIAIREYHAHIFYDVVNRMTATELRIQVAQKFSARMGRWCDEPAGPHLFAQYQIAFDLDQFQTLVPFLMLNRMGLTMMVHPMSGHSCDDHTIKAMWAGEVLPLNLAFLRELALSR